MVQVETNVCNGETNGAMETNGNQSSKFSVARLLKHVKKKDTKP